MKPSFPELALLTLLAAWLALPPPALADPPPWAPAHGYRAKQQYRYVYYPRHEVYYAPETQLWFWLDGGRWRAGASLPVGIVVADAPGVAVVLGSDRPYVEHDYVVEHYGRHRRHRDDD